jgi:hypothetical protein
MKFIQDRPTNFKFSRKMFPRFSQDHLKEHLLPVPVGSTEAHFLSRRKFQWHSVSDLRRFRQLSIEIAYDRIV